MNKIQVLFFATLKERAGVARAELELEDGADVADLKQALFASYPELPQHAADLVVAVNKEYADNATVIPEGAEVAVFPPVSGGSEFPEIFAVIADELDLNAMLAAITLPTTGAACFFSGMVRGVTTRGAGHQTEHLEYEAYQPMAEAKMQQVADEIRAQWPEVEGIAITQRIGVLQPGTPTVLIACTAGHRDSGVFEAARYGIDRLKEIVPVWKKEVGANGEMWVEGDYLPSTSD